MEKNTAEIIVKIYAALTWLIALFGILAGLTLLMNPHYVATYSMMPGMMVLSSLWWNIIGVIYLIVAAFEIVVGFGLWNYRQWARIAAIILGVILLFIFPVGTIIGIIGIWLFGFDESVRILFEGTAVTQVMKDAPAPKTTGMKSTKVTVAKKKTMKKAPLKSTKATAAASVTPAVTSIKPGKSPETK